MPAGSYGVLARGYTASTAAMLHADLIHRRASGDELLGGLDSKPQSGTDFHLKPYIDEALSLPALTAGVGDSFVLRITYASGTSDFSVLETSMTIPSS